MLDFGNMPPGKEKAPRIDGATVQQLTPEQSIYMVQVLEAFILAIDSAIAGMPSQMTALFMAVGVGDLEKMGMPRAALLDAIESAKRPA